MPAPETSPQPSELGVTTRAVSHPTEAGSLSAVTRGGRRLPPEGRTRGPEGTAPFARTEGPWARSGCSPPVGVGISCVIGLPEPNPWPSEELGHLVDDGGVGGTRDPAPRPSSL